MFHKNPSTRALFTIMTLTISSFAVGQAATPASQTPASDWSASLDKIVQDEIDAKSYPGAVLIVGRDSQILHQNAYGKLTFAADAKPMAMNTLFDMASISKVVGTASAAMALAEEGRLDINKPVADYVNGFGADGKEGVRVRDLLTHTSGLKSYDSAENAKKLEGPGISSSDAMIMRIASLPLSYKTGSKTEYSCLNMLTEARVNENILGGRQDDFLRSRVWGPLGMNDTTYLPTAEELKRTAPTIRKADGTDYVGKVHDPLANYHSPALHCPGNAGVFSTAPDMARFCEMTANLGNFRDKQIYKPETIKAMTSVQTPKEITNLRGLGWDIHPNAPYATPANQVDGKRVVSHTGYTGTMIWIDMNTRTYFVFLTNRTYPDDSKKASQGTINARRKLAEAILKHQPEYAAYFQK